jgi:hypothetical protein
MTQSLTPLDWQLVTVVLATLAVGLPILFVLAVRFLWDRNLSLGRSRELEKLIWQLHRIASAMEHQMNLSFPAIQPGTEQPSDGAYLQQPVAQKAAAVSAQHLGTPAGAAPAKPAAAAVPGATAEQTAQQPLPPLEPLETNEAPRHGGVNSMFGF